MTFLILLTTFLLVFLVAGFNLIRWTRAYEVYQRQKFVLCPDTHLESAIMIAPGIAATTTILSNTKLVVRQCTFWPDHRNCDRQCVKQFCRRLNSGL